MFFFGSYEHSIDAKGRVSLPSTFRKEFGEGAPLVLVPGSNGEVNVFSQKGFSEWLELIFEPDGGFKRTNRDHVRRRMHYSNAAKQVEVDKAGRISIPPALIECGGFDKTIMVCGDVDHVSLWDPARRDEFMGDYAPDEIYG